MRGDVMYYGRGWIPGLIRFTRACRHGNPPHNCQFCRECPPEDTW